MKRHKLTILTTTTLLLTALPLSTAFAEYPTQHEQPITKPSKPDVSHILSVTFSPLQLINPVFELSAEYKVIPNVGVSLIGAYGSQTIEFNEKDFSFPVWKIGAQGRYYVLGNFDHGMQLGAEAHYISVSDKKYVDGFHEVSAYGTRAGLGAFVGYKIATNIGFTFEAQGGAIYSIYKAVPLKANPPGTTTVNSDELDTIRPLININLGWSF